MAREGRSIRGVVIVGLAGVLWGASAYGVGSDPTPAEIVNGWNTLSGGLAAKVVYWEANTIRVMDLTDGSVTNVLSVPDDYSETAATPWPVWSPDGTRICYFRPDSGRSFWVVNENGTNPTMVVSGLNWDYGVHSWWSYPTVAGDWIVAQKNNVIVRVEVNADNTPGATVDVLDFGEDVDWLGMSGYYVGFTDWSGHGTFGNACLVVNWQTLAQHDTAASDVGACSMNIKQDGSGTSICAYGGHAVGRITAFDGTVLDDLSPLIGERIEMMRWSHHPDFLCQNANRMTDPRSDQRAWIRKLSNDVDTGQYLFLGYGMWGPDVWVDLGPPPTITVTSPDGGESWTAGSAQTVTWTSGGTVGNVKIELSTNGGSSWTVLVASTSNDDTEPVTLPAVESTQCLIRVSETDGSPSDASDGVFSILYLDTDGDGMPDWWEDDHGFDKTSGSDAAEDADSDGLENLDEYLAGTDPHDEDTDGDGLLDGDDKDPLNPPSTLAGGCSAGGAALPLVIAISWLAARLRRREGQ